jgi:acetyl-CoA acetyltransferase
MTSVIEKDVALFDNVEIPYRGYWSTPFAKWQGPFAGLHSIRFAAKVAKSELARRKIEPTGFDHAVLGVTIPQWRGFWGAPWLMSMVGSDAVTGPTIVQACQTGPRSLIAAAYEVAGGQAARSLVVTCDRMSNGAFVSYPGDGGWGGLPKTESWTVDNFLEAPDRGHPVLQTAENVASRWQISREQQHDVVLMRYAQYQDALADDRAFQRRYMSLPFDVPDPRFKSVAATIDGDVGVSSTSRQALDRLAPVDSSGTVTYASQTHPADGNAALIVATTDEAREISADPGLRIRVRGFGQARSEPALMPAAPIPAARVALQRAGLDLADIDAVKSHNPFVVNDIVFARETGYPVEKMNNFGSSLVFGHPQGPTGTRLIIELIEELVIRGGGYGLYHGCAAGDAGFALVIEVADRSRPT